MDISFWQIMSDKSVVIALVVVLLIALCSSLFGVTLVLKRFSFIGDGLSHAAFGVMAVAAVLNLSNSLIITLPITILVAILLLCGGPNSKIKGDASIAIISVSALAFGYLLMNVFNTGSNVSGDICGALFGSIGITTMSWTEFFVALGLSIFVVLMFVLFYNKIFSVTFDENFAKATGTHTKLVQILLAVVLAILIVLAMKLIGSLLVSALIIFPALSAMRIFKSFLGVTIASAVIGTVCALVGFLLSVLIPSLPVGATIVLVNLLSFGIFAGISVIPRKKS